ncbi:Hypp2003 [Branchiostoma lanceolatum]|nr:Hypp2003 [Branchiostoma lanceolatum]
MNKWMAIFLVSALLMLAAEAKSVGPGGPLSSPADEAAFSAGPFYLDGGEDVDGAVPKRTGRGTSEASFWKLLNLYRFHPGASFGWCHWPVSMRPASCFKNGIRPGTPVRM